MTLQCHPILAHAAEGQFAERSMDDAKCRFGPAIALIEHLRKHPKS
jgi:hypothetical protein